VGPEVICGSTDIAFLTYVKIETLLTAEFATDDRGCAAGVTCSVLMDLFGNGLQLDMVLRRMPSDAVKLN
jgi:hypothetical protein